MGKETLAKTNHFDPMTEGEREELLPAKETTQDMFLDDSIADPEGAKRREEYVDEYPDWIFGDYELSDKNIWGKRWPDGRQHLIARASTIAEIMQIHQDGQENYRDMVAMAHATQEQQIQSLKDTYETLFSAADAKFHFNIMKGIASQVNGLLADRAYRKYLFIQAAGRTNVQEGYLENLENKMYEAASDAGIWYDVHRHVWSYVQWKNAPTYLDQQVENELKLRLVGTAKYLEQTYASPKLVRPTANDRIQVALAC